MRRPILLLFILLLSTHILSGQSLAIPQNYTVVDTVKGDLDKDGIAELVVAYNTQPESKDIFESVLRELVIYKNESGKWSVWRKSQQALYGSKDGGMMGDPFEKIEIKNGILLISQNGGSTWKWGHTDKYRYQEGEFYLIGYSSDYGKICEHWTTVDYNLATGRIALKKEFERCEKDDKLKTYKTENEIFIKKGVKITIEKRSEKEIKIVTPKYGYEIYLTTSSD